LQIFEERDEDGQVQRVAYTSLGQIVNCPSCLAFIVSPFVVLLQRLSLLTDVLGVAGAIVLVTRWWSAQRIKAEWWL